MKLIEKSLPRNGKFLGKRPSTAVPVTSVGLFSEILQVRISMFVLCSLSSLHSLQCSFLTGESTSGTAKERGSNQILRQFSHIKHLD